MGYYTNFDIETDNSEEVVKAIEEVSYYGYFNGIKWYDHEDDLKKVSLMFPDTEIFCSGEGEDYGDIWKKKALNGKIYRAKAVITFTDYE